MRTPMRINAYAYMRKYAHEVHPYLATLSFQKKLQNMNVELQKDEIFLNLRNISTRWRKTSIISDATESTLFFYLIF